MSSGQGFDFFGFEWWYSFNKKTFRSFTFLERKKESDFFFKKKKREVEGSLFSFEVSVEKTKALDLPLETRILATGRDLFSWIVRPPSWIRFLDPASLFRTVPVIVLFSF
jgi:hypothetical protein